MKEKLVTIPEYIFIELLEKRIAENVKRECLPEEIWDYFILWIKKNLQNIPAEKRDPFSLVDNAVLSYWRKYSSANPPPDDYIKIFRSSKIVLIRWGFDYSSLSGKFWY